MEMCFASVTYAIEFEMLMLKTTLMTAKVAVRGESCKTIISNRQFLA
jgi:hypothetical protein